MDYQKSDSLQICDLSVEFHTHTGIVQAVKEVSVSITKGKITALVGESGSGKSVTSLALMGLLPRYARIPSGKIICNGRDILRLKKKDRQRMNGSELGMIFQDPLAALDPLFTIEQQMIEGICRHKNVGKAMAKQIAIRQMALLALDQPEYLMKRRPFELSGGMCQRVMIAMIMALEPDFLVADEPTTALDVTVQKQILEQLYTLCRKKNIGILFITHDLGVVAEIADTVSIMREGCIVESGSVFDIFDAPKHEYSKKLIRSIL